MTKCTYKVNGKIYRGETREECDALDKRFSDPVMDKMMKDKSNAASSKKNKDKPKKKISFKNLKDKVKGTVANMKKDSKIRKSHRQKRKKARRTFNPYD
jgi:hypothetical protein